MSLRKIPILDGRIRDVASIARAKTIREAGSKDLPMWYLKKNESGLWIAVAIADRVKYICSDPLIGRVVDFAAAGGIFRRPLLDVFVDLTDALKECKNRNDGMYVLDGDVGGPPHLLKTPKPNEPWTELNVRLHVKHVCQQIYHMMWAKNEANGNSELDPIRCFSKANPVEQIRVRIDDKLSRLMCGRNMTDKNEEDTVMDLIGYLVLLKVAERRDGT